MSASLGTRRARLRMALTAETHAQARSDLGGPDGVPDALHPEQAALEAAVLSELHDPFARDHDPLDPAVYGIIRVRPARAGLVLHLAGGLWEGILDLLLPEPDPDLDVEGLSIAGIPGLRCRPASKGRVVLYWPGTPASVTVQLPPGDVADAALWIAELASHPAATRSAADWTAPERLQLPTYTAWHADSAARSRVLRRLMAFRPLPAVSLIDASGDVPSAEDFAQLLKVHGTEQPPPAAVQADPARPLVLTGRPVTVAVVGPHRGTAGLGGVGRSSTAVGIARALAQRGLRVLVADADPYGRLVQTLELQPVPNLEATAAASPSGPRLEDLRAAAADARFDVVLLDGGPSEQRVLAEVADRWIGVSALWPNRSGHPFLGEQVVGRTGMPLPDGWDAAWLSTMRANRWTVRWRLAPLAFDAGFAAFDADGCAGVVPVGERTEPGARAVDFLSGLRTRLPVLPAVPFAPRGGDESSGADAYDRIAAVLLASTPVR